VGRSPKEDASCEFTISRILVSGYASDDVVQRGESLLGFLMVFQFSSPLFRLASQLLILSLPHKHLIICCRPLLLSSFPIRRGYMMGMLKKAASSVLAILPCSRTMSTLRSSKWLRPFLRLRSGQDWTNFFEHSLHLTMRGSSGAFIGCWGEIFNSPMMQRIHILRVEQVRTPTRARLKAIVHEDGQARECHC